MAVSDRVAKALDTLFKNGMQGPAQTEEGMLFVARNLMPLVARPLVQQMGIGPSPVTMLDSACGSGVVTDQAQGLLREGGALEGSRFVAADSSQMLVDIVKRRVEAEGWTSTETEVLDAMVCRRCCLTWWMGDTDLVQDTKLPDDTFTHVAIGLGLHLIPRPDDVLKGESLRS